LRTPNFAAFGLAASDRVRSATDLARAMAEGDPAGITAPNARVLFLNGWHHETHPAVAADMLQLCLRMQQHGSVQTVFMAGNLKVAVDGMEACCQAAKAAGAVFVKVAERLPRLAVLEDGRVGIDYWDASSGMAFRLIADYTIVDECIGPDPALAQIARVLKLTVDPCGFVQSDNVHRLGNQTNRRGVFVTGAARAVFSAAELRADNAHGVHSVAAFLSGRDRGPLPAVEIDQGLCARCLTCYRLCPHAAVAISPRMVVIPEACQACGICAAGCPSRAITVEASQLPSALERLGGLEMDGAFVPRIAVFCCRRSAAPARESALSMAHDLPRGLVVIEGLCGGTFSTHHLLSAFEAGVDGVMVLTCHPGNCHSELGTTYAEKRSAGAAKALAAAGLDAARVRFDTLAANMGTEFAERANDFERAVAALGPLRG